MSDFLLLSFIFLVAGVVAVPIATRLGLGSVLGYLVAGISMSPILISLHIDIIAIQHFAEFGVVMMLFLVGLELEPKRMWELRSKLLGLGGLQVGLTISLVAFITMFFLNINWQMSVAIGCVLALSSTAIVLQTLQEKSLMRSNGGQSSFSVLLFQDIAVIPMLALFPLLATLPTSTSSTNHPDGGHGASLSLVEGLAPMMATLVTVSAILFVIFFGLVATRPLFRFVAAAKLSELFTATALLIVIGIALLMTSVGLSPALGTFLAGVLLANSEYRHQLESDVAPFKGLLLGLFFMTVGASIQFQLLFANFFAVIALALGLMLLKALILFSLTFIFKIKLADKWLFTLALAQAGEFGFVLISVADTANVLPKAINDWLLLIVAISMLLTPILFIIYERLIEPRYWNDNQREADVIDEENEIIIAGQGRVGGVVMRILRACGYRATVIDHSEEQLAILRTFGFKGFFGDASRPELLHAAGIERAKIIVVTISNRDRINTIVEHVIHNHPHVHVIARAVDRHHVYELYSLGCRDIIRDTYDGSVRMGRSALVALGIDEEKTFEIAEEFDQADRSWLSEVAHLHDPEIPPHRNQAYIDKIKEINNLWEPDLKARIQKIIERT